ncbi:hypothetical protein BDZ94DRAFT_1298638 [Collybia nuda]|uniref:Protein-S-isoprenylcysteine O-methyltransferase n=1 Tax=Collybia nuda TaxID=64659 RepID=A0A9P6CHH8_9AGAR|nr:hypothetical protein BDZ94DRAFT_1298638 [Collybia nuda]
MSMAKPICILLASVGLHCTFTPPSTATKGEQLPIVTFWDRYMSLTTSVIQPRKMIMCAVGMAEVAAIVAYHSPSSPLSKAVLSILLPRNNPQDLRLTSLSAIGTLLIMSGALIRKCCYRAMHRFFTFELTIQKGHELITTGPYGVVRHPSYSGITAVYLGIFCLYGSCGSWVRESGVLDTIGGRVALGFFAAMEVVVLAGLLRRMSSEDMALKKNFGEAWGRWAHNVPYSLIPWVY